MEKETKKRASVLLDVDDTLLDFHKAEAAALAKTLVSLEIEPRPETLCRYSEINARQWELLEEGVIDRDTVLTRRFDLLFEELGLVRSGARARDIYEGNLAVGHYFMPGAPELLEALYGKYALYIVSNGTASVQAGRIGSAGIARYFDGIFISEEIGFDKPSRAFFEGCFARMEDFDPERALIVGDSLTSDIRGGLNAGIRTCWFNSRGRAPRPDIVPNYEIKALSELPGLLERLFPGAEGQLV